ncbi:MAG: AMP-binding protein [Flavobacteriaceae bacterium]|nr:AMP-binding protein [Flavobacteriaceae bacterium]
MLTIHPQFKLNSQSVSSVKDLIVRLKNGFEADVHFIQELFDSSDRIIAHTSGSTGKPKKIKIPKKALLKSAEATGKYFDLPAGTKALHCISSQFIAGKMMWVRALHLGWQLTLIQPNSDPMQDIGGNFDFAAMVPLQAQNSFSELHRIGKVIIGGAALEASWEKKLASLSNAIYQTYGMTETITHIAVKKLGQPAYHCLPQIQIEQDQRGCLVIHVPYLHDAKIITNDLVSITSPHTFIWLGRYDHVINSGGIKLIPEDLETKLQAFLPYPFFLAGIPNEQWGQKLVLLLESEPIEEDFKVLFQKAGLTTFETPKEVYFVSKFIYTSNNKINRIDTINIINK